MLAYVRLVELQNLVPVRSFVRLDFFAFELSRLELLIPLIFLDEQNRILPLNLLPCNHGRSLHHALPLPLRSTGENHPSSKLLDRTRIELGSWWKVFGRSSVVIQAREAGQEYCAEDALVGPETTAESEALRPTRQGETERELTSAYSSCLCRDRYPLSYLILSVPLTWIYFCLESRWARCNHPSSIKADLALFSSPSSPLPPSPEFVLCWERGERS